MSVNAVVENGKILDTKAQAEEAKKNAAAANQGYDKNAFMNILCAQMKYQDPLEPTSNTEYINQYATFTQVEQLSNMAEAFSMSRASDLVGKTVIVSDENGGQVQGKVDYVTYKSGEAYLNIDGKDYKMEDVSSVADSHFVEIHDQADDLAELMDKFPAYENMVFTDAQKVYEAYNFYQSMDADAIALVDQKDIDKLEKYYARAQELVQEAAKNQEEYEASKKVNDEEKAARITEDLDADEGTDSEAATAEE
ncbi:flagellar hook capping FlgD N-terminal domain-containing protein [Butyrivibrio sp. AC2005]|jgi:flagellar basal-body rod modification protein FlgD|uniref:flagellar hook capping FlgD N-terminal domain-containing protein n=1 Tax=Butyrivibrio sp. AC2005 TaxID=1280672 RepID=UPI0003F6A2F6|nr:flagellar hook capping FlgD N-terminal domain-containing protein [Butyrivibrio sp. AC2005]